METSLRGYALAVLENAASDTASGGVEEVARDLREVSDVISTTSALAQLVTDEMVAANARRAVVEDLLSERVVAPALRIVLRAISTEHADGLLSVLGELAELARAVRRSRTCTVRGRGGLVRADSSQKPGNGLRGSCLRGPAGSFGSRGDRRRALPLRPYGRVQRRS